MNKNVILTGLLITMGMNWTVMAQKTDSPVIQKLIDDAKAAGKNEVTIPGVNPANHSNVWIIGEAIKLPSNITVYIDNCTLRMADSVLCPIFQNAKAYKSHTLLDEQENIRIIGKGNVLLDGGIFNGYTERGCHDYGNYLGGSGEVRPFYDADDGKPVIFHNTTIMMNNVNGLEISNLTIREPRYWALTFIYARNGKISDIVFDCNRPGTNQDGIDLRVGCNNFEISNLSGKTTDDAIALNTSNSPYEIPFTVVGKSPDIHDIKIKNIEVDPKDCNVVDLVLFSGHKIYNIDIENVHNPQLHSIPNNPNFCTTVNLGYAWYLFNGTTPPCKGDLHHVIIKNASGHGARTIQLGLPESILTDEHFTYTDCVNNAGNPVIERHSRPDANVGVYTPMPLAIIGPSYMKLSEGYAAVSAGTFSAFGNPVATMTKTSGDAAITWNDATKRLDIAAGLAIGQYEVTLTAGNSVNGVSRYTTHLFTLAVEPKREPRSTEPRLIFPASTTP